MYADGEYDLAGFAVGVVARKKLGDGTRGEKGGVALALPSSGLHSNGYSLARKVLFGVMKLEWRDRPAALLGQTVGEALLTPTRLYARATQAPVAGGGTNLQAILDAVAAGTLDASVAVVISNVPGAGALARAQNAGVPVVV